MNKTNYIALLFKYQEFLLYVGLMLWLSIFYISQSQQVTWTHYLKCTGLLAINYLPVFIFSFNKTKLSTSLAPKQYLFYWLGTFLIALPTFTLLLILVAKQVDPTFLISATLAVLALALLLVINQYYQKSVQQAKWLKKIGLEKAVFVSLVLLALTISIMGASSLGNPAYQSPDHLLIGFEFSLPKVCQNFGTFSSFFLQFLLIYLAGYLFFIINSRILVSKILKEKGLILYLLSMLTTVAIFYPIIAQILISLPINKTLGRDIFSSNPFDFENAFGVIIIMLLSLPIVLSIQWGKQNNHIISLEKEKSQTELDLLKQQLNPHFFFNTLNNLYALSLQKSDKTPSSILQLAELMRYTIYKGQEETVSLEQELKYTEDYIELQQIRLKKPLNFRFEKDILDLKLKIAPLLLIVLIENAFKHGIEPAENAASLCLSLQQTASELLFTCENSYEPEEQTDHIGIGLNNLRKRLELIYPNRHQLQISSNNHTFSVQLQLQLP